MRAARDDHRLDPADSMLGREAVAAPDGYTRLRNGKLRNVRRNRSCEKMENESWGRTL